MQVTERDIKILKFVNEFGFCNLIQIEKYFHIKFRRRTYQIMERLIKGGFLLHRRIFHNQSGIYYVSREGARLTDLPAMSEISLHGYQHQLSLIDVFIKLKEVYPDTNWISERQLKQETAGNGWHKKNHRADGILVFPEDKQIAIEVELTQKSKRRLDQIFKWHASQFSIHEVWYFSEPKLISCLTKLSIKMPFIKIHNIEEFLA